ncbi:MAG: pyridoxine 5'-phosphate synthase [Pseudomonadota bacterium]|nr:pyridoxine 5'-phosphate synthase [Pseudomonadota bacterium]
MTVLSVNLNKVALLRNSREGQRPSVIEFARLAIAAGAGGITVHPRPDQRHVRASDVPALATMLKTEYPHIEFNIEGNPVADANAGGYPGFIPLIKAVGPAQATLVPDSDDQLTSDHGWDLSVAQPQLRAHIEACQQAGARVSLFMDPVVEHMAIAADYGADRVEFYTGPYAETFWQYGATDQRTQDCYRQFALAAEAALHAGLGINAGHDLDQQNLPLFANLPGLAEVSIGHAIICEALIDGFSDTVAAYAKILQSTNG